MKKTTFILIILVFSNPVFAFKLGIHEGITKKALEADGFDALTRQQAATANWEIDIYLPFSDAAHADNNRMDLASIRLERIKDEVVLNLQACKREDAVVALGRALHTVQDLASHTNAVDNNHQLDKLNLLSLRKGIDGICNGLDRTYAPSGLVSGYFNLYAAIDGFPQGFDYSSCYGTFFIPTGYIEDGNCCHLHLNKDNGAQFNGGSTGLAQTKGKVLTQNYLDLIYDEINRIDHENLEYYKKMFRNEQIRRMYVIDTTGSMEEDIETIKEQLTSYLDRIVQDKGTEAPALGLITFKDEEEDQIENDFVCSKSNIELLKDKINDLTAYGGDDCPESSAEALLSAINYFSDGTFSVLPSPRSIFVHTDAPSHNPSLFNFYRNMALDKHVTVNPIQTEGCEVEIRNNKIGFTQAYNQKNNREYSKEEMLKFKKSTSDVNQDIAENTGGISFNVNKDELDKVIPITLFMSETDTEVVYSQKITVDSFSPTDSIIKIDDTMSTGQTMIMVKTINAASLPTIALIRPNGMIAINTDNDITVNNLSTIVTYTIDSPAQGEWKVSLSNGSSTYLVRAYAQTDFGIAELSLLKEAALNVRQVPYMAIVGNPISGDELLLRVSLTQAPDTLTLKLLSEDQTILSEPVLIQDVNSTNSYEATIVVPNEDFNIKLEGTLNSSQFQREIPLSIKPTKVKLAFDTEFGFLNYELYGIQTEIKIFNLHLTNTGSIDATYSLSTNSQLEYPVSMQDQITIPAGRTMTIPVSVSIPNDAIVGSIDEIMIIVQDINDENNSNYKVAKLIVKSDLLFANDFE